VATAQTAETFRPPFCGSSYKPYFKKSQIRMHLLPALKPTTGAPTASYASNFQRIWLDHKTGWSCRPMHPKQNMPNYGREIMKVTSTGALSLCLDIPNKETLLINYIQVGIDLFGTYKAGNRWYADGGHANGRKLVILFAAQMLGDTEMMNLSNPWSYGKFGEDDHTYYGQPTTEYPQGKPLYGKICNPPNYPYSGKGAKDCRDPNGITDDGVGYGTVNHPHWPGEALAAHIMGIKDMWNHDAFFDFVDRYMKRPWSGAPPQFQLGMWLTYRNNLPTVGIKDRNQNPEFRIQKNQHITLYPNPMQNIVWFDSQSRKIQQITIYDNAGNMVYQTVGVYRTTAMYWNGLDRTGNQVQPGVYYYSIITDGIPFNGRIVKTR
jgi:hypothetical protein